MIYFIQTLLPYLVVVSQVLLVVLVIAVLTRAKIINFLGNHAILAGLVVSLTAVIGSLFYSEIVGYTPCVLCWWQRVFLYPQVILFALALWKKDRGVFKYSGSRKRARSAQEAPCQSVSGKNGGARTFLGTNCRRRSSERGEVVLFERAS